MLPEIKLQGDVDVAALSPANSEAIRPLIPK